MLVVAMYKYSGVVIFVVRGIQVQWCSYICSRGGELYKYSGVAIFVVRGIQVQWCSECSYDYLQNRRSQRIV